MQDDASDKYGIAAGELRSFVERVERLEEEKRELEQVIRTLKTTVKAICEGN